MQHKILVNDTCKVVKTWPVLGSSGTNKKDTKGTGPGTRVFRYKDIDYCKPVYEHNDGLWAVFVCFMDGDDLNEVPNPEGKAAQVARILMENPRDKDIFIKDKRLAKLGGFYSLNVFDNFGKLIDTVNAVYAEAQPVSKMKDTKLNGKPWTPSAEVLSAMAVIGSYVYPAGSLIAVDSPEEYPNRSPKRGFPNVESTDPSLLKSVRFSEQPPFGEWTYMTAHIHPLGQRPDPIDTADECPANTKGDIFTWRNKKDDDSESHGPSTFDLRTQYDNEQKDILHTYKSVVVDRHFIWLYSCVKKPKNENDPFFTDFAAHVMRIKRRQPSTKYDP